MSDEIEDWGFITVAAGLVIAATILIVIRHYIKGTQFREKVNAKGKIVLITGANSGIGYQLVREFNLRGAKVYLLVRSEERGREAVRDLAQRYGCDSTRMIVRKCDLASFASVRQFCETFETDEDYIDVLCNNAGIMFLPKYKVTEDGHELTVQSNHLGHFLLTELLLTKLENSPNGARIINVSSKLHVNADSSSIEKMDSKKDYGIFKAYARSKLAQVIHAVEMTKRLRRLNSATKVTINSCHPGAVDTSLVRISIYQNYIKPIIKPFLWYFFKTAQDGAQTPLFLALSKKINGVSGKYFSDCAEVPCHPLANDEAACQDLYNQSVEATKLG